MSNTTKTTNRGGVSRVLSKLESSIDSGNYYEAHQMYRTLYFRYLSKQKYSELLDLLYKGATQLLNHAQFTSGADLSMLLVDVLEKAKLPNNDMWIQRLGVLFTKIGPNILERDTFLVKSIKWSCQIANNKYGSSTLHKIYAQIMWSEGNFEQARHHFLLSKDGPSCGHFLIQLSLLKGFTNETDLFVAQIVLQQLSLKEKKAALDTFETYTKYHPKVATTEPPFFTPLLNFIFFLLKIIDIGKLSMFTSLCCLYEKALKRDSSYDNYLKKIGVLFFGVPPQQQQPSGGIFGDFLNQLFQDLDDDTPRVSNATNQSSEQTELD